uniref:Ice-structuring protein n=1 Tax=Neolamprologus brichardi TaxID=32507 RepID=A0A3Q4GA90_NEOBR
ANERLEKPVFVYTLCLDVKLNCSVIAKVAISKGTVLSPDMFAVKVGEPKGIPPENMQNLVGKKIKVDVKEDDSILADMIE